MLYPWTNLPIGKKRFLSDSWQNDSPNLSNVLSFNKAPVSLVIHSLQRGNRTDGSFIYPTTTDTKSEPPLLVLLLSVYVSFSKNSSLFALGFWPKADAKVRIFQAPTKLFSNFFSSKQKIFLIIYKMELLLHYYKYKARIFSKRKSVPFTKQLNARTIHDAQIYARDKWTD